MHGELSPLLALELPDWLDQVFAVSGLCRAQSSPPLLHFVIARCTQHWQRKKCHDLSIASGVAVVANTLCRGSKRDAEIDMSPASRSANCRRWCRLQERFWMRECASSDGGVYAARTTQLEAMGGLGEIVLLFVSVSVIGVSCLCPVLLQEMRTCTECPRHSWSFRKRPLVSPQHGDGVDFACMFS